ncbi:MAG: DNA polymerase III subunit gamma/tau [Salinibacter sp.]|uniref:DNA polymerase III subunit gamma/tau n=1 Tax=Salinibacter sp. TaxID=2065818 RepID=UPI0035D47F4C
MEEQRYLVAARKYRPSLFREVIAQEHVTETLKNAIRLDRLAHAYLFSGPRGVGKTTAARILAKAINCETPREERDDEAEPCCECDSCRSFEEGRSLNVFEMDAASNNKVDDIRELREKVRIPPQGDQKKVYILDEVHMLSKQAFNALLKTLEEPPAHALFIFATTEPHKVLPTILSRCQRFDFRRIPVPKIVGRLREVCEAEGVEADEESLMLLARKGNGALRDALSAFDQALSLCGSTLKYSELTQALGVVDQDLYFRLTGHIATRDTAGMLELVRHVVRSGYDLQEVLVGLAEHLRNLLVAHSLGGDALEEVAKSTQARYAEEAERFAEADLLRLLTMASDAEEDLKQSAQPRLTLETTLLKMAQLRRSADLREVLQKIDRLEQMAEDGELPSTLPGDGTAEGQASSSPHGDAPPGDEPTGFAEADTEEKPPGAEVDSAPEAEPSAEATQSSEDTAGSSEEAAGDETSSTPEDEAPAAASADRSGDPPPDPEGRSQDEAEEDARDEDSGDTPGGAQDASVEYGDLFGTPALEADDPSDEGSENDADGQTSASARSTPGGSADTQAATVAEPSASSEAGETLIARWPQAVQAVREEHVSLGTFLGEAEPVECVDGTLTVAVPRELHRDTLRDRHQVLLRHLTATVDASIEEIRFVVETTTHDDADPDTSDEPLSPREHLQQLRDTYPALEILFGEFGAEPVW